MISDYLSLIFHKVYRFSSGSEYGFLPFYVLITPFTKWYVLIEGNKFICWLLIINEKQQWWQSFIFLLACLRYILSRNSCISTSLELEQLYMNHVWGITHFMSNLCCFIESWRTGMILRLRRLCLKGWNILRNISWKCSRWLVEKKPVKTPPVLQDSTWSLGGQGCSWFTRR